jgi:SRSO17 transposase
MNLDAGTKKRLEVYLNDIGEILKYPKRKAAFATYVVGLFSMVERKTAEGLAALTVPDPQRVDAEHQRLLHVIGQSKWDDRKVRRHAAQHALAAMTTTDDVESWIVDDTGWLKKGDHSVGVQRQYTGTSGKIDNCQLGVSLVAATHHWQVPLDFDLYLPESWTEDPERRQQAKIPNDVEFQTKQDLALAMIDRAVEDELPLPRIVLSDVFYGRSGPFRAAIRDHHLHYGVGVRKDLKVRRVDKGGARRGPATNAAAIAKKVKYRCVTWTDGSDGKLSSHFAFVRVIPIADLKKNPNAEALWLVIEKTTEREPYKFSLCSLPKATTHRELIRLLHQRWRTERVYQDMKQEFGLDQYQGRSYIGWHHHVTAAMVCHAFTSAEQARLFPPRADGVTALNTSVFRKTPTPFRRIHPDDSPRNTTADPAVVVALPFLPTADAQSGQIRLRANMTQ